VATGEMLFATTEDCRCTIDQVLLTSTSNIVKKIVQRNNPGAETVESAAKAPVVATPAPARHRITPLWVKIATAAVAVGAGIGGYYFNARVQDEVKSDDDAYVAYASAPTHASYVTYQAQYNQNCDVAKRYGTYRNVFYGVAVLGCAGFAVTFFF
jgi:hypothetical protein